jgi:signal transduction histidine kinase
MKAWRYGWWACAGLILLVSLGVSLALPRGFTVTAFGDLVALFLFLVGTAVMLRNALTTKGQSRAFWSLMTLGFAMWTANHAWWSYYEVVLKRSLPDPFAGDIVLFLHVVPFMTAIALRPHRVQEQEKLHLSTLNFLMVLAWWVFLYAFIVFPDEYVVLSIPVYTRNYDLLYLVENSLFLFATAIACVRATGAWRRVYANLCAAAIAYGISSAVLNHAITKGTYYSGSAYDLLLFFALSYFVWFGIEGGRSNLEPLPREPNPSRWATLAPRLAMIAILSLPTIGLWALFFDHSIPRLHQFRLFVCLVAMLVLGAFVFLKQYLLDHQLMRLLQTTDRSYQNLRRLQTELVQKEKLASLGRLVAGAAHEINNPVTAILGYSDLLSHDPALSAQQVSMAQKIGQQARRTRDLVSDLLSFAQQAPAEKSPIDVGMILQRAVQVELPGLDSRNIRVEVKLAPSLPSILGNAHQLLQSFTQILSNAIDALEEVRGGTITVTATVIAGNILVEFSDTGPGIREPRRVFDPFYTTKPIGKGTGLGLSATYGVIQNHKGQITCRNRTEGGAVFSVFLPIASGSSALDAEAAHAH